MVLLAGLFEPQLGCGVTQGSVVANAPIAAFFVASGALAALCPVLASAQTPVAF